MPDTPNNDSMTRYRCSCGHDFVVYTEDVCEQCGRPVRVAAFDPALTATLCAFELPKNAKEDDRFGEQLGHFQLKQLLGAGGMGAVYRALDTSLQRYVAVKVLRGGSGSKPAAIRINRLLQEAVAQARLNHPNVVTIYYVGRHDEEPFLAMELMPGPTLEQKVADGVLPFSEVVRYGRQIVAALKQAEQLGLAHGDIKPSNLLTSHPGQIKLGDFGLSRPTGTTTDADGPVSGTPNYLAPELVDGGAPNHLSDMYALGVTLFELSFGRRPFELKGEGIDELLRTHHVADIEFPQRWPAQLPEQWRGVLQKLLAKSPDERYHGFDQLDEALKSCQPIGTARAARLPRVIAYAIDSLLMFVMLAFFMFPAIFVRLYYSDIYTGRRFNWMPIGGNAEIVYTSLTTILILGGLLVPLLALFWDIKNWHTPGRFLMQLRVVDMAGFVPTRRTRATRSLLRNLPFWIGAAAALPASMGATWIAAFANSIELVWLVVDGAFLFTARSMAFHDRICGTHVRLASADDSRDM